MGDESGELDVLCRALWLAARELYFETVQESGIERLVLEEHGTPEKWMSLQVEHWMLMARMQLREENVIED